MRFCGRSAFPASFNPRAREGRDIPSIEKKEVCLCFNPRAREGRDTVGCLRFTGFGKFQSTRPRGARHGAGGLTGLTPRFNPRAREGRDW